MTEIMRTVPGIAVAIVGRQQQPEPRFIRCSSFPVCYPAVFLDGVLVRRGGSAPGPRDWPFDEIVAPSDAAAVEAYTNADVPPQYGGPSAPCGAVLLWTRHWSPPKLVADSAPQGT